MTDVDQQFQRAIGLDVGGTKVAGGVVNGAGDVMERLALRRAPGSHREEVVEDLIGAISELMGRHHIDAIGIGAAGLIDWPEGHIRWAPSNGYDNLSLRSIIEEATSIPTIVDNDAHVATWAEANLWSDGPQRHLAVLTVGTGLGAGLLLDGRLYRGSSGIGAELGHILVDKHSKAICSCGMTGCLESLASGTALGREGRAAAQSNPGGLLARMAGGPQNVTGETVYEAARRGDTTSLELFAQLGYWLGVGAATLVTLLDLELIIVGGGLAVAGDLFIEPMREAMTRHAFATRHRTLPKIALARLGPDAGWIGAGMLSLEHLRQSRVNGAGVATG